MTGLYAHCTVSNSQSIYLATEESIITIIIYNYCTSILSIADDQAVQHLLFHFNGLESSSRPARLTPFKLIPRSSQNAIGVSVAMGGALSNSSSGCCPIEEVTSLTAPICLAFLRQYFLIRLHCCDRS